MRGLPVGAERATGYLPRAVFSRGSEFSICFGIGDREHAGIQDSIHEPAKILFKFNQKSLQTLLNLWSSGCAGLHWPTFKVAPIAFGRRKTHCG